MCCVCVVMIIVLVSVVMLNAALLNIVVTNVMAPFARLTGLVLTKVEGKR